MVPTARISDRVSDELIRMVYRNVARALVPLLLAIGLSYLLLANKVDERALAVWAGVTSAVVVMRAVLMRRVALGGGLGQSARRRASAVLSLCAGAAFGTVLVFFPVVGTFERAMLTAILLGVCSGAVSSNSGYRPLFLAYTLPMLAPLGLLWIANPTEPVGTTLAVCVGVSVLLVAATLASMAQEVFDAFALSVESSLALERQTDRLSDALEAAERAQARAETSSASKSRFIAAASHDLRQPVHVLNLYGAALRSAETSPKVRAILDDMELAVDSLSSQLETLLDISRLDGGNVEPEIEAVDLSRLTATLAREFGKLAEDKRIRLIDKVPEPVCVLTDRNMLAQILRNLCGNAIKFTRSGSVRFVAETREETVALSIVDTGIGIDDEDSRKVFEEFYQASNPGRDKRHGSGLGLSIVERLVTALGHEIELDSTPGVGTRVTVTMRRCATPPETSRDEPTAAPSSPPSPLPAGFWVHIVDDDDAVRRSMQTLLESLGHRVTVSDSTRSTVTFLESRSPSAVLVDLRLGDGDSGVHVIDALSHTHPEVPLALITGEAFPDRAVTERYPTLLMLQKPVPRHELLELLGYMAERSADSGAESAGALESAD